VAVDPTCRRRGVGRALIEKIFRDAHDRGLSDVELSAWAFNDVARAAFRRLGFTPKTIRFERRP
jgi:ribosomal protein S18 acetylase RimI-like enzyme